MRQPRNYGALNETHRQVDEQQDTRAPEENRPPTREPRNYEALRETQYQVGNDRQNGETEKESQTPEPQRPPLRSWTHHGGMVWQQASANRWLEQNREIRMAQTEQSGTERGEPAPESSRGEGVESSENAQDQAELQEARAAIEETKRRQAAERSRQQERERSGPER